MAENSASEKALGELHSKVAEVMTTALEHVDTEAGPNPALLSVIVRFLDSNKITCAPEKGNEMGELERKLEERRGKRRVRHVGNVAHIEDDDD